MEKKRQSLTRSVTDIHRTLPHSIEAEQGVLGSMLISPRGVIGECVEKINESYFYVPAYQTIYTVLVELWEAGQAIDLITFTQVLRDRNLLETVGGAGNVTSLFTFVPTAANLTYYLEIVRDKYICREIIAACTEGVRRAFEEQDEVNALVDEVEQKILAVGQDRFGKSKTSMKDAVMDGIEAIETAYNKRGAITGLATGFIELDRMTDGLQNDDMIVIAARPSMGKTAFAMNIAEHVAVNQQLPVAVFSLEMSTNQLIQRFLCSRARVNMQKVRDGFMAERDFPSLTAAASKLAECPMFIDDERIDTDTLRARARRLKSEHDIRLVVVDYLQLLKVRGITPRAQSDRQLVVATMSSDLKGLAKELHIPVVVLAQLNRQPEARSGGKPRISDLRESGAIEQDADVVGLLYRPEVYEEDEEARHEKAGEAELIIAKQRNGPVGEVALTFLKEFTRFEDRARSM